MPRTKPVDEKHSLREEGWKSALVWGAVFFLLLSALLYARRIDYNLFILNKAIAGTAVFLIGMSFAIGPLCRFRASFWVPRLHWRKYFGVSGFMAASLHAFLSLVMLTPAYYPSVFAESGKLNSTGEMALLFGILSFLTFAVVSVTSLPEVERNLHPKQWKFIQRVGYGAYFLVALHLLLIKWRGWFDPANWLHGLPPGSLVSFLFLLFVFAIRIAVMLLPPVEVRKKATARNKAIHV
ncbi:TPA: hypothetical protein HA244_01830 [Candidatus Micrarchaeota archaeon]|nr:hypothetical protein [Candidatus Micrarchaeota archaeon]